MTETNKSGPPVVIAGTGHGCRVHLPALRASGFNVVGLVGGNYQRTRRRAERNGVPHAFEDLDTAIATTGAVAVVVASPPTTHAELVHIALARGCHVLCEKPFARNAEEAREMLAAAEQAGVVHLLGNQFRALPERIVAADAIAGGILGEPRFLTIVQYNGLVADTTAPKPEWWFDKEAGGGWLGASGSHMIDMVHYWLGPFASVSAALPVVSDRHRDAAEDSFLVRFELANGVQGMMQQTGGAWGPHAAMTRVAGTQGSLWLESGETWVADKEGSRQLPVRPELQLQAIAPSKEPGKQFLHIELPSSLKLSQQWYAAIEGDRGRTDSLATFVDGVACMEVIDAIRHSAAKNGELVQVKRFP